MKLVPTALLAASMLALGACGGGGEENVAADNATDDLYNVAPDDLGTDNLLGNETLGNDTSLDNSLANTSTEDSVDSNAAGNSL